MAVSLDASPFITATRHFQCPICGSETDRVHSLHWSAHKNLAEYGCYDCSREGQGDKLIVGGYVYLPCTHCIEPEIRWFGRCVGPYGKTACDVHTKYIRKNEQKLVEDTYITRYYADPRATLESYNVKELRSIAASFDISGRSRMHRRELINNLLQRLTPERFAYWAVISDN
jgi:hypothetical protein